MAGQVPPSLRVPVLVSAVAVLLCLGLVSFLLLSPGPGARESETGGAPGAGAAPTQAPASAGAPSASAEGSGPGRRAPAITGPAPPRSPMPMEGERITRPLPTQRLVPPEEPLPAPDRPVHWAQAPRYLGATITVESRVVDTHRTPTVCFLNFTPEWRGQFYVVMFKDTLEGWPEPPERHLLNKVLRITGKVVLHNGRPQIQVRDRRQIEVVEEREAPEPGSPN